MLLIKTKIDKSNIHGIGLFAAQFISKGTIVWKFRDDFDLRIEKDKLNDLSKPSHEQALKYGYISRRTNKFIIPFDDSRFFNHSDDPNVGVIFTEDSEEEICIALKDIIENEELIQNYKDFDMEFDTYHDDLLSPSK